MVEDNSKIEEKIQRSPFIQDRRPQQFLPRGKIWKIRRWETGMPMLEVRPLIDNGGRDPSLHLPTSNYQKRSVP